VRFVYPVKYIFFTNGYTTGYGLLVAFVACWVVWHRGSWPVMGLLCRLAPGLLVCIPHVLFCFLVKFDFQIHYRLSFFVTFHFQLNYSFSSLFHESVRVSGVKVQH